MVTMQNLTHGIFITVFFERAVDDAVNIESEIETITAYKQKHLSNPNIRAINNKYEIVYKNGSFKLVSNSLSQHFYK